LTHNFILLILIIYLSYGGVKGLGVGVFGGLTAIVRNTITATKEDGVTGIVRGVATGAIDTVCFP
jgi:hypothetical protein